MLLEFLLIAGGGFGLSVILFALIKNFIESKLAWQAFKKQLPQVPFIDQDRSWLSNTSDKFFTNSNCLRMHRHHLELGDYVAHVSYGMQTVSTCNADLIRQVCLDQASKQINRQIFRVPVNEYENDCILSAQNEQWRHIRKSFAPALKPQKFKTPNVVREIESSIYKLVNGIEQKLNNSQCCSKGCEFDIGNVMLRFSMSVVMTCFYKQPDIVNFDLDQHCEWSELLETAIDKMKLDPFYRLSILMPSFRHLIDFITYYIHPVGKWRSKLFEFIQQQTLVGLKARKHLAALKQQQSMNNADDNNNNSVQKQKIDPNDFILPDGTRFKRTIIDHVIDEFHAGKLNKTEYFNTSAFLMAASTVTAADALVYALYQIAVNPRIQEKLRQSVQQEGHESIYLGWVINEALRLNPPVPGGCSRKLTCDIELPDGLGTLPEGALLSTSLFTLHRLEKYWGTDALEFKPERFEQADKFHPAQYLPFGAGIRTCLGKEFALFEMRLLISTLINKYKLECRKLKTDLDEFDAPMLVFLVHRSPFILTLSRL